jgi:hypothetical protein
MRAYKNDALPDFEANIFQLHQPILCNIDDCVSVLTITFKNKTFRLYPPFPLNDSNEISGAFSDALIPEGNEVIDSLFIIDDKTPTGLSSVPKSDESAIYCDGLRIDAENDSTVYKVVEILLEQICQHASQWWVRGGTSPFKGIERFQSALNKKYRMRARLLYSGGGRVETTFNPVCGMQNLLGFEKVLTNNLRDIICRHVEVGHRGEPGLLSFYDAIAKYMTGDDIAVVVSLCVCIEILGNKHRILQNKSPTDFNKLIASTKLVGEAEKKVIKKMLIDRGHVAHGRLPHLLGKAGQPSISDYIEVTLNFMNAFINTLDSKAWSEASQMRIERK